MDLTYQEFEAHIRQHSEYEAIYDDTEGRRILVIQLVDIYFLCHTLSKDKVNEPKPTSPV